jgi:hypothetical protein
MSPNPILVFGVAVGFISAIIVYLRHKGVKRTVSVFVLMLLAFGTPLHFLMVGVYLGWWVNQQIYGHWSHNWGTFLVSLIGLVPLFGVWQLLAQAVVGLSVSDVSNAGGVIVLGIGVAIVLVVLMMAGLVLCVISSFYRSFKRLEETEI